MSAVPAESSPRREFAVLTAATLVLVLGAFYAAPAMLFLLNGSEVTIGIGEVIKASWRVQAGLIVAVAVVGLVGGRSGRRWLVAVLLALAALCYLQGNVMVWDYGRFDGTDIDWSSHRFAFVCEILVWAGVLLAAVVYRWRLWGVALPVALVLALCNGASLGAQLLSGGTFAHAEATEINPGLAQFSPVRNTLIVIMDAFPGPAFDLMLAEDPSWRDRLAGFTYYQDALAVSPTTLPSIPAILSGQTDDNSRPVADFLQESLASSSLPMVLQDNGFKTYTVTQRIYGKYLAEVPFVSHVSFLDAQPQDSHQNDALRIWNAALFRYSPHFIKMKVYADHQWLLRGPAPAAGKSVASTLQFSTDDQYRVPSRGQQASWILWRQLLDNATADSRKPTFKFLHFFTTHTPLSLNGECGQITKKEYSEGGVVHAMIAQSTCAMNQFCEILDRMRDLGVLDQTLVILAGDHGSHVDMLSPAGGKTTLSRIPSFSRALPLLLVKMSGASGPMQISEAPVSLIDIPNTVVTDMGIQHSFPGLALQNAQAGENRLRVYYDYTWKHSYWWEKYLPPLTEYKVNGPVREPASWSDGLVLPSGPGQ